MVLAVYWPPHAPAPGQATFSSWVRLCVDILPAACSGAGTGQFLERGRARRGLLPRRMRAHGLEDVVDGDVAAFESPGRDGPAVEEQRRKVQAQKRHRAAGNRLVAANQGDDRV